MRFTRSKSSVRTTAAVALLSLATVATARAADGTPMAAASAADVQKLVDDGNYNGAVTAAGRLLSVSGQAAAGIDKGQVYAIKGEAQLHLKQYALAAESFDKGAKAAGDPVVSATDAATAVLARRVKNGTYTPRQPGSDGAKIPPIDVLTADGRRAALTALFADEMAADKAKLDAAKTAKTVPQLLAAAQLANGLRQLEVAATGSDDQSKAAVATVAAHAHELLESRVQADGQRVADISRAANAVNPTYGRLANGAMSNVPTMQKVGLTSRNASELRDVQATCQQIGPAADAFAKAVAQGTPATDASPAAGAGTAAGAAGGWDALTAEAGRVAAQAQDVLTADYGQGTVTTGTRGRGSSHVGG